MPRSGESRRSKTLVWLQGVTSAHSAMSTSSVKKSELSAEVAGGGFSPSQTDKSGLACPFLWNKKFVGGYFHETRKPFMVIELC